MLLYWILVVTGAGKLMGGQFKNLAQLQLRGGWWLLAVVLVQLGGLLLRQNLAWLGAALVIASYAGLLFITWINRRLPGVRLVIVGIALNFLVITANGGAMPITYEALEAIGRTHQLGVAPEASSPGEAQLVSGSKDSVSSTPNLIFLGDVIVVPLPGKMASAISFGDVLISAGIGWLILWRMRRTIAPGEYRRG
jgi:hypothetical protein